MRQILSNLFVLLLIACPVLAQAQGMGPTAPDEWEVSIEGGNDFRSAFARVATDRPTIILVENSEQASFSPSFGVSYMRRITNLRAYYGVRIEGHVTTWEGSESIVETIEGDTYTASALIAYKAFLFDMEGDCNCPRWDKTNFFKKAFFVEFGAGGGRQSFGRKEMEGRILRTGFAYMARAGFAIRLKKQIDVTLAGGAHGLFASNMLFGKHDVAVRPALGVTWRPFYSRN
ncbi:MAG: hypothetical protein AB8F78_02645 [Saprospiraceae bacterium]